MEVDLDNCVMDSMDVCYQPIQQITNLTTITKNKGEQY